MGTQEEYRQRAEEAQRQADLAHSDADREAWLRMAHGWQALLFKRPQSDQEQSSN
jgi:hypothetical protein